jgi:sugar phosphate isomerase/epimerase
MALKAGITNYSFARSLREGNMTVEGFLDFCGKAGFDGVDLMVYFWKDKDAEIRELPRWLARNKLELVGYGVGNDFLVHDKDELQKAKDIVGAGIEDAARIGCKMMRVFGGHKLEGFTTGDAVLHLAECFKPLVEKAEKADVVLTIENHGGFPAFAAEVLELIDLIDSPYFASLLDTGNFLAAGADPLAATKKLAVHVKHVHVKDMHKLLAGGERGRKASRANYHIEGCVVGEGDVPNGEIVRVLSEAGYDGYLSLEAEAPHDKTDEERALAGLKSIRNWIARIEG